MALSGSFYSSYFSDKYRYIVEWSANQSEANNTSTITAKTYIESMASTYDLYFSAKKDGNTTIDGQSQNWTYSTGISTSGNSKHLINTTTKTVSHESDGSLTLTISSWMDIEVTIKGTYYSRWSTSKSITLDKIDKAACWVYAGGWKRSKGIWVYNNGWKPAKGMWVYNNGWKPVK